MKRALRVGGVVALVSCSSSATKEAAHDAGTDGSLLDAGAQDAPVVSSDSDSGWTVSTVGGPCVEGMLCSTLTPTTSSCDNGLRCACVSSRWTCLQAAPEPPLLPGAMPRAGDPCFPSGPNVACTQPDECGALCACTGNRWICTVVDGGGGGARPDCPVSWCPFATADGDAGDAGACVELTCETAGACDCHEH